MQATVETKEAVVIKFAGDSGDGMQLTGSQFTNEIVLGGSDISTFPDFPAEIRAPQGTLAGVSGFQLHFGSREIYTPGDEYDVLVAMNAAALKVNIKRLKKGGILIANTSGFDSKNLRLAGYDKNPLQDEQLGNYTVYEMDVTRLTRECLEGLPLGTKEKDRSKNMFVLGFLFWMYNKTPDSTIRFLQEKFDKDPVVLEANIRSIQAGYNYGDTTETFTTRFAVAAANLEPGVYRNIMGNQATVLGLITASKKSGLPLFYGSYPITPASDILHMLARHKNFGVKTFQAEDEIAAICSAIGASFGGCLGVTGTSGPGMALKTEAMGLAVMLEIPLVIIDVQRGGPSTGLPTKTEQADLLQALYGRNSECPMPVVAASSPSDCFESVFEACRIAIQHMTPVIFLSDGYIANGSEPWKFPAAADIPEIKVTFARPNGQPFMPYQRDEKLSRPWAIPGTPGLEHRVGGLEKENITGNVSYDPDNHELMVKLREEKVQRIADYLPQQKIEIGPEKGKLLILGWGSTYGVIKSVVKDLYEQEGLPVAHVHLRYLKPFPTNLGRLLRNFEKVLIPEINNGQLIKVIRDQFLIPAIGYNRIRGVPITKTELKEKALEVLQS
ncbi:MAG: 2-oxoglutarate ferredoxin oxidoreductase subunit alpha [Chitinophagales bacterium]|nr:MAG: 2-oxoglutarate ferredoxin oxidoreductase subunit alpha [Chitinophagales bacterium]